MRDPLAAFTGRRGSYGSKSPDAVGKCPQLVRYVTSDDEQQPMPSGALCPVPQATRYRVQTAFEGVRDQNTDPSSTTRKVSNLGKTEIALCH